MTVFITGGARFIGSHLRDAFLAKVDARVVFASSGGALYGKDAPVPSMESVSPEPESPYGISKYSAEKYIALYNRLHGRWLTAGAPERAFP
jgi:nucleoside-diphosphate-sugar epimerase